MRVTYHREAEEELAEAARYYAARGSTLGAKFLGEIDRVVARIAQHPTRSPVHENDIRFCLAKKFPYAVYYRAVADEGVRILAVKHTAEVRTIGDIAAEVTICLSITEL